MSFKNFKTGNSERYYNELAILRFTQQISQ
ncbi:uncharacterized protein METZ01_LOCUS142242, partial [marine metagenome]